MPPSGRSKMGHFGLLYKAAELGRNQNLRLNPVCQATLDKINFLRNASFWEILKWAVSAESILRPSMGQNWNLRPFI